MSLASDLGGGWVVHALGWTLLHFCWQGSVVAAVLWCVLALTEGCSARMRYGLACAALALMVALPVETLVRLAVEEHRLAEWMRQAPADLGQGMVVWAGGGDRAVPWTVRATVALDRAAAWLPIVWAVGLVFFLVRMRAGFAGARRMTSVGTGRVSAGLAEIFDRLRVRMGVMRPVRLLSSAAVEAPTVIGWLRPVVLVPVSCLTGLSEEQIGAILAHELAHVRRHDYLVNVAQTAVETLLFYHPCVWWVSRQVRRERECCCDDVAVAMGGESPDRLGYARALATLEEFRAGMGEVSGMALGANGGVLTMRIRRVLGMRESGVGSRAAAALVLAVLVMVGGATAFSLAHAQQKTGQAGTAMRAEDATDAKLAVAAQGGAAASIAFSKGQGGVLSAEQQNALKDSKVFQGLSAERQQRVKERIAALDGLRAEDWKRIEQTKLALAEKLKSPEFKAQMEAARGLADTIGNSDFRKRVDEIVREGAKASGGASSRQPLEAKLSSPEFKKEMADALAAAEKVDTPEFRKQMQDSSRALQDLASPEMRGRLDKLMAKNAVAAPGGADDSPVVAPPPTGPVRVSGGVMAGAIVTKVDPVYPPEAKAAGCRARWC